MNSFDKIILNGTDLVVDSSDIEVIKKYASSDVTTNPSLILKNFNQFNVDEFISNLKLEDILVKIGLKISKHVNGLISTEVNPSLSYDTENTVRTARKIIKLYEENGLNRNRILIKIVATWEGIKAAEILEKEGIKCNMTLVLSFFQAVYCAKVGATLISPFVGRIDDNSITPAKIQAASLGSNTINVASLQTGNVVFDHVATTYSGSGGGGSSSASYSSSDISGYLKEISDLRRNWIIKIILI